MNRDDFTMTKFNEAIKVMENLGAIVVDNVKFSEWDLNVSKRPNWKYSFRVDARTSEHVSYPIISLCPTNSFHLIQTWNDS